MDLLARFSGIVQFRFRAIHLFTPLNEGKPYVRHTGGGWGADQRGLVVVDDVQQLPLPQVRAEPDPVVLHVGHGPGQEVPHGARVVRDAWGVAAGMAGCPGGGWLGTARRAFLRSTFESTGHCWE